MISVLKIVKILVTVLSLMAVAVPSSADETSSTSSIDCSNLKAWWGDESSKLHFPDYMQPLRQDKINEEIRRIVHSGLTSTKLRRQMEKNFTVKFIGGSDGAIKESILGEKTKKLENTKYSLSLLTQRYNAVFRELSEKYLPFYSRWESVIVRWGDTDSEGSMRRRTSRNADEKRLIECETIAVNENKVKREQARKANIAAREEHRRLAEQRRQLEEEERQRVAEQKQPEVVEEERQRVAEEKRASLQEKRLQYLKRLSIQKLEEEERWASMNSYEELINELKKNSRSTLPQKQIRIMLTNSAEIERQDDNMRLALDVLHYTANGDKNSRENWMVFDAKDCIFVEFGKSISNKLSLRSVLFLNRVIPSTIDITVDNLLELEMVLSGDDYVRFEKFSREYYKDTKLPMHNQNVDLDRVGKGWSLLYSKACTGASISDF